MSADQDRRVTAALAKRDPVTGLTNRQGWDLLVEEAQLRIDADGVLVAVAVTHLEGEPAHDTRTSSAGVELIRRAAHALLAVAGSGDLIARYDDRKLAILSNNVAVSELSEHFGIFADAMTAHGVAASTGFSVADSQMRVVNAIAAAELQAGR